MAFLPEAGGVPRVPTAPARGQGLQDLQRTSVAGVRLASRGGSELRTQALRAPPTLLAGHLTTVASATARPRERPIAAEAIRPRFQELVRQWEAACSHLSSTTKRVKHPAFRAVVALGEAAIPLLLEQLAREPGDWDLALHEITGQTPVAPGDEGKMAAIATAWLSWGARHGYRR